ncbi:MAG: NAD(P)-dependent oxidoreductase [Deltaproteobacteria bacterium]|nr:NAD(P)-dependent oxidoreductase [Deltaproteobacteria bacterium]
MKGAASQPFLVTGAGGLVGYEVLTRLLAQGRPALGVVSPGGSARNARELDGLPIEECELASPDEVRKLVNRVIPRAVINCAAVGVTPRHPLHVSSAIDINVRLPGLLYECLGPSAALVHVGSMYEFRPDVRLIPERASGAAPEGLYGWSKATGDGLLALLSVDSAPRCVRARLFLAIGPREAPHRLLPSVVAGLMRRQRVALSDGLQIRDILHVRDVATGLIMLAESEDARGVVNVARGEGITIRAVAEYAASEFDSPDLLDFGAVPRRTSDPPEVVAVSERLRAMGWQPSMDVRESVHQTVQGLREVLGG